MDLLDWARSNQHLMGWMFLVSVLLFLGSLIAMPIVIARLRRDYFLHRSPPEESWRRQHPVTRYTVLVAKNVVGLILFAAGVAMLVLPGQGVITMLVGISFLDFPGKRRLELRIIRQRPVLHAINWIRARARRPPLILPDRDDAG